MRYQIKEALDKIINMENADPSRVTLESAQPNDIKISYRDTLGEKKIYRYADGSLSVVDPEMV